MRKLIAILMCCCLLIGVFTGCSQKIDYPDVAVFEADLNKGEDLTGKTVQFEVKKVRPDSAFGYNLISGEHLNFVSDKNPGAAYGDIVSAKVTEISSMMGSWIINYKLIKVEKGPHSGEEEPQETEEIFDDEIIDDGDTGEVVETTESEETEPKVEVSESDFGVTEYFWNNDPDTAVFLAIKNNGKQTVGISVNVTGYDADDNVVGAGTADIEVIGSNEESICYCYFENATVDHISYSMSFDEEPYGKPILSELDIAQNVNGENVIVTVTNNSDKPAYFVEAYAIFLDSEGKVVYSDSVYIMDANSSIQPGAALSETLECYYEFDSVVVLLTGRAE